MLQLKDITLITLILVSFSLLTFLVVNYDSDYNLPTRNYVAEAYLGITPNMPSRQPTSNDIDTQLNLQTTDGNIYRLFESRDTKDFFNYGKTFVVRVK